MKKGIKLKIQNEQKVFLKRIKVISKRNKSQYQKEINKYHNIKKNNNKTIENRQLR